jgi:hypothetical protein
MRPHGINEPARVNDLGHQIRELLGVDRVRPLDERKEIGQRMRVERRRPQILRKRLALHRQHQVRDVGRINHMPAAGAPRHPGLLA